MSMSSDCAENRINPPSLLIRNMKPKRRSSILKTTKPLEELQNISSRDDRLSKDRRVSFANTIKIKEFLPNKASKQEHSLGFEKSSCDDGVSTVDLPDEKDTTIQISTPKGKKCRRISVNTGSKMERFSLIPKLDRSFSYCELDEDFEVFEEDSKASVAELATITLAEVAPQPAIDDTLEIKNDFGVEVNENDCELSPILVNDTHQVSKDNEVSDMELTNCETKNCVSPQVSLSLYSPESMLKPSRALETTMLHPSQHVSCESLATNDASPSPAMPSYADSQPEEDCCKLTDVTMEITCEDSAHLDPNSDLNSSKISTCTVKSRHQSNGEHSDCNRSSSIPANVNKAVIPSQSTSSSDQHVTRIPPNPFKPKQTPSKTMLLLASPYIETPHCEGIVHLDTPVHNGDIPCGNTTKKSLAHDSDDKHILSDQEGMWKLLNSNQSVPPEGETTTHSYLDVECIRNRPCHDHSSSVVSNDVAHPLAYNWLQNTDNASFALVDSSPVSRMPADSNNHSNHEISSNLICTPQPSVLSAPLVVRAEESQFRTAVPPIKANTNDKRLSIKSPEMIPVKCGIDPNINVTCSFDSFSLTGDLTLSQEEFLMHQSLRMSPSVFSKFFAKLECDRSVENSNINMEDTARMSSSNDAVSVLSSSLASTHITSTSNQERHEKYSEHNCSSVSNRGTTGQFSALLETLNKEIALVLHLIQLRINNKDYLQTDPSIHPCLQRLMTAANRCFCTVNILSKFETLSSLSSAQLDLSILKLMSKIENSDSDLHGDRQTKAKWILNMHHYLQTSVYPTVELVLHEAASIFPWHINKWTETEIEITCHHRCLLKLNLSKQGLGTGSIGVQDIHVFSKGSFMNKQDLVCSTTDDIPQMLQNICSQE